MFLKQLIVGIYIFFSVAAGAAEFNENNPLLHLSLDQSELIQLTEDAASIIVANPSHASVLVDTPRHVVVVPRQPGTTSLTILNESGDTILSRQLVIGAKKPDYVKIRRACGRSGGEGQAPCQALSYYYCPDGCDEMAMQSGDDTQTGGSSDMQTGMAPPTVPAGLQPSQARE